VLILENLSFIVQKLFLDSQAPEPVEVGVLDYRIAFRLGRTRNITRSARIVYQQFQGLARRHLFEANLGARPVERAFNAPQVQRENLAFSLQVLAKLCRVSRRPV
jgi:hypothetical protein